jgi:hypothetical protein
MQAIMSPCKLTGSCKNSPLPVIAAMLKGNKIINFRFPTNPELLFLFHDFKPDEDILNRSEVVACILWGIFPPDNAKLSETSARWGLGFVYDCFYMLRRKYT